MFTQVEDVSYWLSALSYQRTTFRCRLAESGRLIAGASDAFKEIRCLF